ncbi:unnamed protein product [Spirodela intermedia]|uniref:Uncharacterized protein n=1 Tax=Spirodela intermedia TaxID=51605 RepID=A0A7I8J7D4_SPIIN|nr:unnamed protein product [Spirodela intermedia]CAA6665323.1 unnamed protein product [Spirodela intermedia]
MVMIELSESERLRAMPPPNFSAAFATPSLRWACKKRLRCLHPDAAAAAGRRFSSFDDDCTTTTHHNNRGAAAPPPPPREELAVPPRRLPASSLQPQQDSEPFPGLRDESDDGDEPLVLAPDLYGGTRDEASRRKGKKNRRVELWVSLSRDEIEEDFLWMTGAKPPRRSRRRDKGTFDHLLMDLRRRYRVPEPSDPRKVSTRDGS